MDEGQCAVCQPELKRKISASFRIASLYERKMFSSSQCMLTISVGCPVHESEKFQATIDLVNRSFKSCILMVDDSIQRFTLQIDQPELSDQASYDLAVHAGDLWLQRNQAFYQRLTIPYQIFRWHQFQKDHMDLYQQYYADIEKAYCEETSFRDSMHADIEGFIERRAKKEHGIDRDFIHSQCIRYLKEECAMMRIFGVQGCQFEVYPSGRGHAMGWIYEHFIKPHYPDLFHIVGVRFKK